MLAAYADDMENLPEKWYHDWTIENYYSLTVKDICLRSEGIIPKFLI